MSMFIRTVRLVVLAVALASISCVTRLEGLVSKRADRPYRAGRSKDWINGACRISFRSDLSNDPCHAS
jgi:hypothetical protein